MIKGNQINLRAIERSDLEKLRNMRNEPENNQYFRTWRQLNMDDQERFFKNIVMGDNHIVFGIENKTGELIGVCRLSYIQWQARIAEAGIYTKLSEQGKGYGTEAMRILVDFGFNQANLHRITAEARVDNAASIEIFKKIGFEVEGTLRDSFFRNGRYYDTIVMSILEKDLNEREQKSG